MLRLQHHKINVSYVNNSLRGAIWVGETLLFYFSDFVASVQKSNGFPPQPLILLLFFVVYSDFITTDWHQITMELHSCAVCQTSSKMSSWIINDGGLKLIVIFFNYSIYCCKIKYNTAYFDHLICSSREVFFYFFRLKLYMYMCDYFVI